MVEAVAEAAEAEEVVGAMADEITIIMAEEEVEEEVVVVEEAEEGGEHPPTMQLCKNFKVVLHVKVRILVASLSCPRGKEKQTL